MPELAAKFREQPNHVCTTPLQGKPKQMASGDVTSPLTRIQGFQVVYVAAEQQLKTGNHVTVEEWRAPDLECYPLREVATLRFTKDGISQKSVIERNAIQITVGDPDPTLFDIPGNYVERSPSEAMAERAKRNGDLNCAECASAAVTEMDKAYHRRRGERF